jgi:hypothetical protein
MAVAAAAASLVRPHSGKLPGIGRMVQSGSREVRTTVLMVAGVAGARENCSAVLVVGFQAHKVMVVSQSK